MDLKNCLHTRFFCFFMSCFFMFSRTFLRSRANFYFLYLLRLFIIFFSFLYIPPYYFCFYISPMRFLIFYLLSFISYAIVSVIFRARNRLLMLRLLFLRVQPRLRFLLLLPFLFLYQSSVSAFSSFFLFSF